MSGKIGLGAAWCAVVALFIVGVFLFSAGAESNEGPKRDGLWHTEYYRDHSYVMWRIEQNGSSAIFHDPDCKCTRRKYERALQAGESRGVRDSIGWAIETR